MGKRLSPFSEEFWIQRGYTKSDSEYKVNSMRPIYKEYWIERGYMLDDATLKAETVRIENCKKGALKSSQRPKEEIYKTSKRRPEYWIERGYSQEEAIKKVSEVQNTFSLDKCIEKYGFYEGYNRWKERQAKWQKTLKSKSQEEIQSINEKKNPFRLDLYETINDCIIQLKNNRNIVLFDNQNDFIENIKQMIDETPYLRYYPLDQFILKKVPKIQIEIFDILNIDIKNILKDLIVGDTFNKFLMKRGDKQSTRMWTEEGLLRSSYEIYFYEKFKSKFPNKDLKIDKPYENSSFRYDFGIDDLKIEICPMYETDEKYKLKMDNKKKTFGSILLKNIFEIDEFIKNYESINESHG